MKTPANIGVTVYLPMPNTITTFALKFDRNADQQQRYKWIHHQSDKSNGLFVICVLTKVPRDCA